MSGRSFCFPPPPFIEQPICYFLYTYTKAPQLYEFSYLATSVAPSLWVYCTLCRSN